MDADLKGPVLPSWGKWRFELIGEEKLQLREDNQSCYRKYLKH
jgi:hypothetical protein